ncbi:head decoration protein, partial [Escherichia coli]|uniref:head decoration protein n=1 Tax=Escherichia coli TaxID=562 RepID=UPI003EE324F5
GRHRRFSGNFVQHHLFGMEIHRTAEKQFQKQRTKFNFLFGITGKLVVWDGQKAGSAVGILVLPLEGTETALTYYKSGTFATEA